MVESTFRRWAFFPLLLLVFLSGFLAVIVWTFIKSEADTPLPVYVLIALSWVVWVVVYWGELRMKALKVTITVNSICTRNFFGLGAVKEIPFQQLEGYRISHQLAKGSAYEYLYLMRRGKKEVKLSAYYHKNYKALKSHVTGRLKDLGYERYSLRKELKEIFA